MGLGVEKEFLGWFYIDFRFLSYVCKVGVVSWMGTSGFGGEEEGDIFFCLGVCSGEMYIRVFFLGFY